MSYQNKYRRNGVRKLGDSIDSASRRIYKEKGFEEIRIISDWQQIVGLEFAENTIPKKLSFYKNPKNQKKQGVLTVQMSDSGLALQFSYMEPVILERISTYFGYRAVEKIKIIQNPKPLNNKKSDFYIKTNIPEDTQVMLETMIDTIDDKDLQQSLKSLGQSVLTNI